MHFTFSRQGCIGFKNVLSHNISYDTTEDAGQISKLRSFVFLSPLCVMYTAVVNIQKNKGGEIRRFVTTLGNSETSS